MKKVLWMGSARKRIKEFPEEARQEAGHQLWQTQNGLDPDDWRAMNTIGAGVREIRIHRPHEHRVIYVAQFPEAVYVLHAFEKKTRTTPISEMKRARECYAEMQKQRTKKR